MIAVRLALFALGALGCDAAATTDDRIPTPGSFLTLQTLKGDLPGCKPNYTCFSTLDGLVTPSGRDEAILRYYPSSKQLIRSVDTGSLTFDAWKAHFNFPRPLPGESLTHYRDRAHVAVYYNQNELGLGRALGCATFEDCDIDGRPAQGVACYVTNYGEAFNDYAHAIVDAQLGLHSRNTVVISYQPSLPIDYQVQFAAFDGDTDGAGHLKDSAQLDLMGYRPIPQICTNCHGGAYDPLLHLVKNAHFLPANVFAIKYGAAAPYRQQDQIATFRFINNLAFETDLDVAARGRPDVLLTPAQKDYLRALYDLPEEAGSIADDSIPRADRVPASWSDNDDSRVLWRYAILPYCSTCHNALPPQGVNPVDNFADFAQSHHGWSNVRSFMCEKFEMPHAQPTFDRFWREYLTVDGTATGRPVPDMDGNDLLTPSRRAYRSAKSLIAMKMNHDVDLCVFMSGSGCNVDNNQDYSNMKCGDPAASGRFCNLHAAGGEGECQDGCGARFGQVGCPSVGLNVEQCNAQGECEPCGRIGQRPCDDGCNEGAARAGVCDAP
jgi:hypothetical protein